MDATSILMRTRDGLIAVPRMVALLSPRIRRDIEQLEAQGRVLPGNGYELKGMASETLNFVIDWLRRHDNDEPDYDWQVDELTGIRNKVNLSAADQLVLEPMDRDRCWKLMHAAYFLELDSLRWAVAQTVATKLQNMDVREMRNFLGEIHDLRAGEMEQIRQEDPFNRGD